MITPLLSVLAGASGLQIDDTNDYSVHNLTAATAVVTFLGTGDIYNITLTPSPVDTDVDAISQIAPSQLGMIDILSDGVYQVIYSATANSITTSWTLYVQSTAIIQSNLQVKIAALAALDIDANCCDECVDENTDELMTIFLQIQSIQFSVAACQKYTQAQTKINTLTTYIENVAIDDDCGCN